MDIDSLLHKWSEDKKKELSMSISNSDKCWKKISADLKDKRNWYERLLINFYKINRRYHLRIVVQVCFCLILTVGISMLVNYVKLSSDFFSLFNNVSEIKINLIGKKANFDSNNVYFQDKNLENIIRKKINKASGELFASDLTGITELDCNNINTGFPYIEDLTGIEYLVNLRKLDLSGNKIVDLKPLEGLARLEELLLVNNKISKLDSLSHLNNLEKLSIGNYRHGRDYGNTLSNLAPLNSLGKLKDLELESSNININELKQLKNLEKLNLNFSFQLKDISGLSNLTNLRSLSLSYAQIENLESLKEMHKLEELDIGNTNVTDVSIIYNIKSLKKLTAYNVIKDKDYQLLKSNIPNCEIIYK